MTISLIIEIYLSKKNYTAQDAVDNTLYFSEYIKEITHSEDWFLPGYSKEEALKHKIIDGGLIVQEAADSVIKKLDKTPPIFVTLIWDGDNAGIRTQNYICRSTDNFRITFSLKVENEMGLTTKIKNVLQNILNNKDNIAVMFVQTNQYQLNERNVFPDRLPVGWMLYLNKKITQQQIPMAAQLIDIENAKNNGTLIISTDNVFDGSNKDDIRKANEIEIQLTALGLLPLYNEIYN
ncbi:immunity 52 family protein [Providencia alcalifaciens]|uniref:Imm52 family immunity protein n=1 Tax=Providencia alcalifaciens TaxID=126385 RepID=UPI001CE1C496|nr:Imm52 family immunity protein [Providencia alcalifaciens]UBX50028.1 immunity 52 family protein [Providencia alcalifaciens]